MIRYSLTCDAGHSHESWFASASAFDDLAAAGRLACPVCGSSQVTKSLMAPRVGSAGDDRQAALARLKAKVEADATYVGTGFATEARSIHEGTSPARAIYGEAKPEEARALLRDGIPVAPLPFRPTRKSN